MRNCIAALRALFIAAILIPTAGSAGAVDQTERESRSTAGFSHERGSQARRDAETLEARKAPVRQRKVGKGGRLQSAQKLAASCCGFRIFYVDTELFDDFDGDGYYTYLRLVFDVDTDFFDADVYADVYVAPIGEPWELIFESDVFTIFGSSSDDEYEVETEFVAGYPPGDYDVLIDVFDAATGELVVTMGPEDSSALSYLPIEDISFDVDTATSVVISSGGGGSLSLMGLAALLFAAAARRRRFSESGVSIPAPLPCRPDPRRGATAARSRAGRNR